jgi:monoterpene epsilon-lactone hydrolase
MREPFAYLRKTSHSGYPPLLVQVGTHEVLYDECRKLVENAKSADVETTLQEFPEMFHSWYLLDIPETHDAFEKIANFVRASLAP